MCEGKGRERVSSGGVYEGRDGDSLFYQVVQCQEVGRLYSVMPSMGEVGRVFWQGKGRNRGEIVLMA